MVWIDWFGWFWGLTSDFAEVFEVLIFYAADLWGWGEAVATHDFADGGGVGWSAGRGGLEDGGDLAEEVGAEEAGGDDGEGFCRGGVEVFEAVDDPARDEDGVAGAAFHCLAVDGVGEDALEAVAGLIVGVVAVGDGDSGSGGDFELEHGEGASGGLRGDEVANDEASEADLFVGGCWHEFSCFPLFFLAFG